MWGSGGGEGGGGEEEGGVKGYVRVRRWVLERLYVSVREHVLRDMIWYMCEKT